jgi:putative intracellular protease/amidase
VLVPSAPGVALAYIAGDLTIVDHREGAGLLLVDGTLDIQATFDFTGLVVAAGGIRIASGASCTVSGALWVGVPTPFAPSLLVDGSLVLRREPAALATADGLAPLPRPAALLGLRDLG